MEKLAKLLGGLLYIHCWKLGAGGHRGWRWAHCNAGDDI